MPIENARVRIYKGSGGSTTASGENSIRLGDTTPPVKVLYTDPFGKYSAENLQDGTYHIVASATSCKTYTISEIVINDSAIVYAEDIYMVERNGANNGSVEGTITDAITGQGITGASYTVRDGWNNKTGDPVTEGVFEDADYTLPLDNGNYTLEVSKEGYIANYKNITVAEGQVEKANITLIPENGAGTTEDQLRVVLTWGEEPWDLDSHLVCNSETMPYHIWFGQKDFYGESTGNLDVDDIDSYGPETVTVSNIKANEKFSYYVHDYTNSSSDSSDAMSLSGAKVQVYLGEKNIATYFVPSNQEGTLWHVFDFDAATRTITPVNVLSYESDPSAVGGLEEDEDPVEEYAAKQGYAKKKNSSAVVTETTPETNPASEEKTESIVEEADVTEKAPNTEATPTPEAETAISEKTAGMEETVTERMEIEPETGSDDAEN